MTNNFWSLKLVTNETFSCSDWPFNFPTPLPYCQSSSPTACSSFTYIVWPNTCKRYLISIINADGPNVTNTLPTCPIYSVLNELFVTSRPDITNLNNKIKN